MEIWVALVHTVSSVDILIADYKNKTPELSTSPVCGLWVYGKDILQVNCVVRIDFGYVPWQGQLEGELITQ